MSESFGVQAGRVCPRCEREDSIPLLYGLPAPDTVRLAERGLVALGGCLMPGEEAAFVCRSCELQWGRDSDPTADEAELAGLLGVGYADVARALGAGWRRTDEQGGIAWFVSGEPAQLAVGVQGSWFVLAHPLSRCSEGMNPESTQRRAFGRDDVLDLPDVMAQAAEEIATRRRRSFGWCGTCRRPHAPELFVASTGTCQACTFAFADRDE